MIGSMRYYAQMRRKSDALTKARNDLDDMRQTSNARRVRQGQEQMTAGNSEKEQRDVDRLKEEKKRLEAEFEEQFSQLRVKPNATLCTVCDR